MIPDFFIIFLKGLIFSLLVYGTYTDLRTFYVHNYVTHSIILLSLPLITLNNDYTFLNCYESICQSSTIHNTLLAPISFSLLLIIIYYIGQRFDRHIIGSADIKVLIPISFALPIISFLYFLAIFQIVGIAMFTFTKSKEKCRAGFVPITIAYFIVSIL